VNIIACLLQCLLLPRLLTAASLPACLLAIPLVVLACSALPAALLPQPHSLQATIIIATGGFAAVKVGGCIFLIF
jgi:hypothetical protein